MAYYLFSDGESIKIAEGNQGLASQLSTKYELFCAPMATIEEAMKEQKDWQDRVMARQHLPESMW